MMVAGLLAWLLTSQVPSDWPQWGGPNRNFQLASAATPAVWGEDGVAVAWRRPLPDGYSSVSVWSGRVFTQGREDTREMVRVFEASTGRPIWQHAYEAPIGPAYVLEQGGGPRATPLLSGGRVFVAGLTGLFHALDAESGKVLWTTDLMNRHGGTVLPRGYASSPIAWKESVIAQVGGTESALIAFDQRTGNVKWRGGTFENSYSSPVIVDVDGVNQLIALASDRIAAFDPDTGRQLWEHPHPTGHGAAVATPLWIPGEHLLFVSSAYGGGSRALELRTSGGLPSVVERWAHKRVRLHHGNAVAVEGLIVGASGDLGPAPLSAIDALSGEVIWRDRSIGRSTLLMLGSRLLALEEDGRVLLAQVTREGVTILARSDLLSSTAWTPPAASGAWLFVRDRTELVAFRLSQRP